MGLPVCTASGRAEQRLDQGLNTPNSGMSKKTAVAAVFFVSMGDILLKTALLFAPGEPTE